MNNPCSYLTGSLLDPASARTWVVQWNPDYIRLYWQRTLRRPISRYHCSVHRRRMDQDTGVINSEGPHLCPRCKMQLQWWGANLITSYSQVGDRSVLLLRVIRYHSCDLVYLQRRDKVNRKKWFIRVILWREDNDIQYSNQCLFAHVRFEMSYSIHCLPIQCCICIETTRTCWAGNHGQCRNVTVKTVFSTPAHVFNEERRKEEKQFFFNLVLVQCMPFVHRYPWEPTFFSIPHERRYSRIPMYMYDIARALGCWVALNLEFKFGI